MLLISSDILTCINNMTDRQKSCWLHFPEFLVFLLAACVSGQLKTLHALDEAIEQLFLWVVSNVYSETKEKFKVYKTFAKHLCQFGILVVISHLRKSINLNSSPDPRLNFGEVKDVSNLPVSKTDGLGNRHGSLFIHEKFPCVQLQLLFKYKYTEVLLSKYSVSEVFIQLSLLPLLIIKREGFV